MKKIKLPHPIKKLKEYIINRFLPAYAKEIYTELKLENIELRKEIDELNAYIRGLETGMNNKIKIINNINGGDNQ